MPLHTHDTTSFLPLPFFFHGICDTAHQVRKHERKALADKEQDEEWLSYELRAYRARYSQLRDERDRLKVGAEGKELLCCCCYSVLH